MTEREPRTVRVDPDVWDRFVAQVQEWEGQKHGEIGRHAENALEEYIDQDRLARVEEKLDTLVAHVNQENRTHTRTTEQASETVEKARSVHQRVADNHGTVVKGDNLVRAIEDIAGADPRTVDNYKGILKRRGLLFEHPGDSPVWTVELDRWVKWTENYVDNNPPIDVHDVIEDYGIDLEQYDQTAEELEATQ